MKLFYASALLLLAACNNAAKKTETNASMPGAYKMLSVHVKSDSTDTTYTSGSQLKMYSEDFMMYAFVNTPDSGSSFGIGSYSVNKDTVTENVLFSASDSARNDSPGSFALVIEKTPKGYKQVIADMKASDGKHYKLTEEYETAGPAANTAIDGAWKQIKYYRIKGKDTAVLPGTQYKMYADGHVIWGHSYADSLKKNHTGVGFGTFELAGNKLKESVTASTYYVVRGKSFDIDVTMNGTDEFTQTMKEPDGTTGIEVYQRLKK